MSVVHGLADPTEQPEALVDRQPATVAEGVDPVSLDVLHDDVGTTEGVRAAVEEASDAGVLQGREDLALPHEARELGSRGSRCELDRDALLEGVVRAHGEVDDPHPSATQLSDHAIGPDGREGRQLRLQTGRGGLDAVDQHVDVAFPGRDQRQRLVPQSAVGAAGFLDVGASRRGREGRGRVKQLLQAGEPLRAHLPTS
jgi:hypothetical protein